MSSGLYEQLILKLQCGASQELAALVGHSRVSLQEHTYSTLFMSFRQYRHPLFLPRQFPC